MNLTTDISTGIGASRFGRDPTFAGRSRSSNVSRVQEDARVSQTTARGVDNRERLGAGPATVSDATAGFGVSKPAITKHVKVLEETGVVTHAVEGRTHVLSLELDVLCEVAEWMDRQRAVWGRFMDVVDECLKEEGAKWTHPPSSPPRNGRPPARNYSSRRRSTPEPVTRSRPSAAGCHGWRSRRSTASKARTGRPRLPTCSRAAVS